MGVNQTRLMLLVIQPKKLRVTADVEDKREFKTKRRKKKRRKEKRI